MKASFIRGYPAMKIGNALIISDLHIGITRDIWEAGISLPSQVNKMAERVNKLKKKTGTTRLVILGDVKHRITHATPREAKEIPDFLSMVKYRSIVIVKGNHDGEIESVVGKVPVRKSVSIGQYCLTHGHMNVKTKKNHVRRLHRQRAAFHRPRGEKHRAFKDAFVSSGRHRPRHAGQAAEV